VDFVNYHSLDIGYFNEIISLETGIKLRERNPERVTLFGDVSPFGHDVADRMEYLVEDVDVDGIKLYPTYYQDGKHLNAMMGQDHVREIIDLAVDYGITRIAVHKGQPLFSAPTRYFKHDDIEDAIIDYPDVTFEIVHTGYSFLEDTIWILARNENAYANFETVAPWAVTRPGHFAEILGELLYWVGPDKLMFGSGCTLFHPQSMIDAIWNFEIPERMRKENDYPEVTDEIKEKILGKNALEYFGHDPDAVRDAAENDRWAQQKADSESRPEPWSSIEDRS
jgi:predicted TIM-barrel fold metal-dependent hydrolase